MNGRARVIALVLVVVAVVGLRVIGHERQQATATTVAATARPSVAPTVVPSPGDGTVTTTATVTVTVPPKVAESGPHDDMEPAGAAETWVRTWLNTSGDKQAWLARLTPITDHDLLLGLAQTDITQVPGGGKGKVLPGTRLDPIPGQADVTARVLTSAGGFDVTLTIRDEKWIVTSNDRARE